MTTADELRLALARSVEDPPPMSADLQAVLARTGPAFERPDPGRSKVRRRRGGFLSGVVVVGASTAIAVAAFSQHTPPAARTGLQRYNPAAVQLVAKADPTGTLPTSNHEVVVIMEARSDCQAVFWYLRTERSPAATRKFRARLRSSDRLLGRQIIEFTNFIRANLATVERTGSPKALEEFLTGECPPRGELRTPIRRGGP